MSSRPRRSSTRVVGGGPTASAATAAAATAAATPVAAASSSPVVASGGVSLALSAGKVKQLRTALESVLDQSLASQDSTRTFLAALPQDLHSRYALVMQRQCEKLLASLRRNCLDEFEVILSEHRLPEKLAEIAYLEEQGGIVLDEAGATGAAMPTPTPDQAVRNMVRAARVAEVVRLTELSSQLEEEAAELRTRVRDEFDALKNARAAVERKQRDTDAIYEAIKKQEP